MEYDSITLPRNAMKVLMASALNSIGQTDEEPELIVAATHIIKTLPALSIEERYEVRKQIDGTLGKLMEHWFPKET